MDLTGTQRKWLWLILLGYVTLGLAYMWATPPLEASDEYKHYPVVEYIATRQRLPILAPDDPGRWLQEAAQPPLYYLMMALLTSWIDNSDLPQVHQVNPHAFVGDPNQVGNKNLIIHDPFQERFPGQGTILAINLIRLASVGLGLGTLLITARLGTLLFSPRVALLATALTAFNPMFLFVSAAVNNDSLAILLGHWGLLLLVQLWRDTPDPVIHWRRYIRLGFVLGLGILTKLSLGGLLALAGIILIWRALSRRQWSLLAVGGGLTLATTLAVSSWWFARNMLLYGDPSALNVFIAVQGTRAEPITWAGWVEEFGTFFRSFWGLFGGVNVAAPNPFYWLSNMALLVGMAGMARWLWRNGAKKGAGLWILPAWITLLFGLLVRWNLASPAFQGRLLFPALGAINVLWARGWLAWWREKRQMAVAIGLAGAFLAAAALLPWLSIRPAYIFPKPISDMPESYRFGPFTFDAGDGRIQLVGVEMEPNQSVTPGGGPVELALYWQLVAPVARDFVSSVHLLGRELHSEGQVDRYPAFGMIPTSRWLAGQIYRDVYHVYVDETAVAPARLRASVSLFDDNSEQALPATGPDGGAVGLLFVGEPVRLAADTPPSQPPETSLNVPFADTITLVGFDVEPKTAVPGALVELLLTWRATGEPGKDYTVFVQLLDGSQVQVTGADGPPVANDYPTSLWREGDWIDDLHLLPVPPDLPPGEYLIRVGLYDPLSGKRLERTDGGGDAAEFTYEITQ